MHVDLVNRRVAPGEECYPWHFCSRWLQSHLPKTFYGRVDPESEVIISRLAQLEVLWGFAGSPNTPGKVVAEYTRLVYSLLPDPPSGEDPWDS